jgi:hypothetical protein
LLPVTLGATVTSKKEFAPMNVVEWLRDQAAKGGKAAAKSMTQAERTERAKKAAAASAKVRSKKARERRKAEKDSSRRAR